MSGPEQRPPDASGPRAPAAPPDGGTRYMFYEGLARPARLDDAATVLATLSAIVRDWPLRETEAPGIAPFATLKPLSGARWRFDAHLGDGAKTHDPVNAVCDFVAELSWERLRARPDLLCLHAAAVEFGEALVLFPSGRRSGKSTLSAALARRGHRLFSDDFVPVEVAPGTGVVCGLANGIAPRLRLPLPAESSDDFRAWVAADDGPANRQYKYLARAPLARANTARPLGAVVLLDRQDSPVAPRLEPIAPEEVMSRLILQNFARTAHAGDILRAIHAMVGGLVTYRLSYHGFEEAAAFLDTAPELQALGPVRLSGDRPGAVAATLPEDLAPLAAEFDPAMAYGRVPGITETGAGGDSFLADGHGTGIHRLNPGSTVIWRLIEEPMRLDEIVAVMAEAFPGVDPGQIRADAERTLRAFLAARLIRASEV